MKMIYKILPYVLLALFVITCNQKSNDEKEEETVLKGSATVLVDETLLPLIQQEVQIFEDRYDAKITLESKSETEVIQSLANDSSRIAIISRKLNSEEEKLFKNKKIRPKVTKFAIDAIALISNKNSTDSLIALQDVINFMQQKKSPIKGLVFDNPNSSTARFINQLSGISAFPKEGVFSFKTNEEAIKYVAENDGMIGVVGLNWLFEPSQELRPFLENVNILSVKGNSGEYVFPSQNDIAEGKYPLARDLYIVNCQGYAGLGMGFSSFITGETGQRIILKSGLVPANTPTRKILVRKDIEKIKK